MDECITKEMTKSLLKAFEGMNESLEDSKGLCIYNRIYRKAYCIGSFFKRICNAH